MKQIAAATIALSLFASTAALAGPAAKSAAKKAAAKQYCAVTGEELGSMGAAGGSSIYKGKKYVFCCQGCKPQFDKNPAKFAKTAKTAIPVTPAPAVKPAAKKA